MAANQSVETVISSGDRAKVVLAIALAIAGIIGYYILAKQAMPIRIASIVAGIAAGGALAWTTDSGKRFLGFFKESVNEAKRVVWPERKETIQITLTVFAFVVVMSILLFATDKLLEWVLYDLIMGWKR